MRDEIRSFWIGNRLTAFERLCIASFLHHGHPFRLFTYEEVEGVPAGTIVEDAASILPEAQSHPYRKSGRAIAHFADWFRWELLRARGGYWVDMDVVCIRPFTFDDPIVFGYQTPDTASIGVLRFPPGHPATAAMVDRCLNPHRGRPEESWRRKIRKTLRRAVRTSHATVPWGEAGGPVGFTAEVKHHGLQRYGRPYTVFYPVHHQHWPYLFDATFARGFDMFPDTRAIHLWNEIVRKYAKVDKDQTFDRDSLIEQLKRKYLSS